MAWLIWAIATAFTTFQFSLQTNSNLLVPDLQQHFFLSATGVGALSASIYLTFLPLQIPVGTLYDTFSTRNILTIGATLCGIGCVLFSSTNNLAIAYLGRMIMGLGCGTGYVGMLNIISTYFPARMFVFLVGLAECFSMLFTALLERLSAYSITHVGWQATFHYYGYMCFAFAALIWLAISRRAPSSPPEDTQNAGALFKNFLQNTKTVLTTKRAWIAGFFGCSMYAIISVFTALWGTAFFNDVYHMGRTQAAFAIEFIFYGIAIGAPLVTLYQTKYGNTRLTMIGTAIFTVIPLLLLIFVYPLNHFTIYALLMLMGAASSGYLLLFDVLKQIFPANIRGTAAGFGNMMVCLGGIVLQPLIGASLDFTHGIHSTKLSHYTMHDYRVGLSILIIFIVISTLAVMRIGSAAQIIEEQHQEAEASEEN
jgi:MFS family permease